MLKPRRLRTERQPYVSGYFYLVVSNVAAKALGFLREVIVAALFGTSPALGLYVLLKSGLEMASATAGGVFQLSLVPRLSHLSAAERRTSSGAALLRDALAVGGVAAAVSTAVMALVLVILDESAQTHAALIAVLGASLGCLLVGVVGVTWRQAGGGFKGMALIYLLTAGLMAGLVFPLGKGFGVLGLAMSWLAAVAVQAVVAWWPVIRAGGGAAGARPQRGVMRRQDFHLRVLVAGNQLVLAMAGIKAFALFGGLERVAVAGYAVVIAGLFAITVARNLSAVVIKAAADGMTLRTLAWVGAGQTIVAVAIFLVLVFAGRDVIGLAFERGAFGAAATGAVYSLVLAIFPALTVLALTDLVLVYANGRAMGGTDALFRWASRSMAGAAVLGLAWGVFSAHPDLAPVAFAYGFATLMAAGGIRFVRAARRTEGG